MLKYFTCYSVLYRIKIFLTLFYIWQVFICFLLFNLQYPENSKNRHKQNKLSSMFKVEKSYMVKVCISCEMVSKSLCELRNWNLCLERNSLKFSSHQKYDQREPFLKKKKKDLNSFLFTKIICIPSCSKMVIILLQFILNLDCCFPLLLNKTKTILNWFM